VKGRFFPRNKQTHDDGYRDLWHIQREMKQPKNDHFHHETVKPANVVRRPIEHASKPGDLILDPFFGSGRILAVAKALGRDYLGIERDPRFYRMGIRSMEEVESNLTFERTQSQMAPTRCGRGAIRVSRSRS
jgi:DNA modification methylase